MLFTRGLKRWYNKTYYINSFCEVKNESEKTQKFIDNLNSRVTEQHIAKKVSGFCTLDKKELFKSYGETRKPVTKKRHSHKSKKVKLDKLDKLN